MVANAEMPDFARVEVRRMKENELTAAVAFGFLDYVAEMTTRLCGRSQELLCREQPLSYAEYQELLGQVFELWNEFPQHPVAQKLFRSTIEKGIASLAVALIKTENAAEAIRTTKGRHFLWDWFTGITYQLEPGRRLGIGSHAITADKSRKLIESLVPIVQQMQVNYALDIIANARFPGDEAALAMFFAAHKNW